VHYVAAGRYTVDGSGDKTIPLRQDITAWLEQWYGQGLSPAAGRAILTWWTASFGAILADAYGGPAGTPGSALAGPPAPAVKSSADAAWVGLMGALGRDLSTGMRRAEAARRRIVRQRH
jgi:hypothetical protein